jgi:hypothetical protein
MESTNYEAPHHAIFYSLDASSELGPNILIILFEAN